MKHNKSTVIFSSYTSASIKEEVSREFNLITKTPARFLTNRNLKALLKFVVNYQPNVLRLLMSVSGHRSTGLEWTAT